MATRCPLDKSQKNNRTTTKPKHDQLFKKAMENPMVAYEFLNAHLPQYILDIIDMEALELEKESFIESDLSTSFSDVIFSTKFANNQDGYIFILLEHQSTPDQLMAFRLFKYMINICDRYITDNKDAKHLPLVYPLVLYNGIEEYTVPLNIWDLFVNKELAINFWIKDYQLVNVHKIPDEELKKRVWSGILEFFLKHIHERQLLKRWQQIADILPELTKVTIGYNYIEIMLNFTLPFIDNGDKIRLGKVLTANIGQEKEGEIMGSITQTWLDEGIEIGEAKGEARGIEIGVQDGIKIGKIEGKAEVAKRLLLKKYSIAEISEITGLSIANIQKLQS